MNAVNIVRAMRFLAVVLRNQQQDPLCGNCKAWCNSVAAIREKMVRFEAEHITRSASVSGGLASLFSEAKALLDGLVLPSDLSGQKKAGSCLLPTGVCFVKSSLAIIEKL